MSRRIMVVSRTAAGVMLMRSEPEGDHLVPGFVILILSYFAIQAVSFGAFKTGGDIDTAELLVYAQQFSWGYGGSQPPLYNWLALVFTQLFGTELIVLSALKFSMLALALTSIFMAARALGLDSVSASAAALGIFAIPEIGWEAQRSLSHSSAMIAFCAASFWLLAQMRQRPLNGIFSYSLLGLVLAAAVLSKYNAVIFFVALFLACWTSPGWRDILRSRLFLWSLFLMSLLLAPHLSWMANHPEMVGQRAGKLGIAAVDGWLAARGTGLMSLLLANLSTGGIVLLVYLITTWRPNFRRGRLEPAANASIFVNLPLRVFLIGNLLFAAGVIATGATEVLNRWLQPVLLMLPLGLVLAANRHHARQQGSATGTARAVGPADPTSDRAALGCAASPLRQGSRGGTYPSFVIWIRRIGGALAALALVMLPASIHLAPESAAGRDKLIYAELYGALTAASDSPPRALVTTDSAVFANLRLIDSNLRVLHPVLGSATELLEEPTFLIWTGDPQLPPELAGYARQLSLAVTDASVQGWQLSWAGRDGFVPVWFVAARQE